MDQFNKLPKSAKEEDLTPDPEMIALREKFNTLIVLLPETQRREILMSLADVLAAAIALHENSPRNFLSIIKGIMRENIKFLEKGGGVQ